MKIRVIVNGARGKMGRLACDAIQNHPHFELVATLGREDSLQQGIVDTKPDIVIELTRADCVYQNSLTIIQQNVHPVIGASGLKPHEIKELQQLSKNKKLGGVIAPNFSLSAVLMMQFSAMAAKFLEHVEIIEAHHPEKWDAPSGTALKTAEMVENARVSDEHPEAIETSSAARGVKVHGVNIHSIRLPGILARQQVIFGQPGETLTISHDSIDRKSFMPGLLLACEKVSALDSLVYGLEHFLR